MNLADALEKQGMPGIIPQAIAPIIGIAKGDEGWNYFTNRPIVPGTMKGTLPETQFGPYTTETAKAIGTFMHYSPMKVDYLITGYFAGLGRYTALGIDQIIKLARSGQKLPAKPTPTPAQIPLLRSMLVQEWGSSSQSVTDLYKLYSESVKWNKRHTELSDKGASDAELTKLENDKPIYDYYKYLLQATKDLSDFRKEELEIYEDMEMDADAKREALDAIDKEITDYAMIVNEVVKTGIELDKKDAKKNKRSGK